MDTNTHPEPDARTLANAIRILAIDAVQACNSGHPGMPMGMADIAEVLWRHFIKHNPADPKWVDRDRFVLSNGHGSMLLYAVLHLTGYDLPLEEIKNFRKLHSRTPGHPEYGLTPGVETTTGPLGQGIANAVGMAIAEKFLAQEFNKTGHSIVDHRTWCFLGDGCMMEGISHEACSFAGVFGLEKLIAIYDDNGISIDGHVTGWFADNTPERFEAYGWRVIRNVDGQDSAAIHVALTEATTPCGKPTLICCRTTIGWGSPNKAGSQKAHGEALGEKEVAATRAQLGWEGGPFEIPPAIYAAWSAREAGSVAQQQWDRSFAAYQAEYPHEAAEFQRRMAGTLPQGFEAAAQALIDQVAAQDKQIATRKSSQLVLDALAPHLPEFLGGSADLTGSNLTNWVGCVSGNAGYGNYLHYGVREFGMAAMMNGMAVHGGHIPFGGTFLVFSDYARNALRLSALMKIRVIYVLTHDSIGAGEDGPTHQPVEHLSSLRLIPGMQLWRPADTLETAVAWRAAIEHQHGPTCLVLTRQNLVQHPGSHMRAQAAARGGYVLRDCDGTPDLVLIATGSEITPTLGAADILTAQGRQVRVVSMPSTTMFDQQPVEYRDEILPPGVRRVAVEAGVTAFWYKYVGLDGAVVGLDHFGESAQGADLFSLFGFSAEHIAAVASS